MRDYGKIAPQFWIGATGKKIRKCGLEAQVVAMYLMTSPHANMIGMYRLPVAYLSADTGIPFEGASKALDLLYEAGFCTYDEEAEVVWVYEMARYQIAESLKPNDNQCAGIQKAYNEAPDNIFLSAFHDKYANCFCMKEKRGEFEPITSPSKSPPVSPSEAPPKPESSEQRTVNTKTLSSPDGELVISLADDPSGKKFDNEPQTPTPNVAEPERLAEPELETEPEPETEPETTLPNNPTSIPPCPHQLILRRFGEFLPMMPQPRIWDGQRKHNLANRWKWVLTAKKPDGSRHATDTESGLDWFGRFFRYVAESDFLTGRSGSWTADLGWLTKAENFSKVVSGNYENREAA